MIGPHLAANWISELNKLQDWQPRVALILQPNPDEVRRLRQVCPNTVIIGRLYHDDSHYDRNIRTRPISFAKEIHDELMSKHIPEIDYWVTNNEVCQDWSGIGQLNTYTMEWMSLAQNNYKCAIITFSVGNPDLPNKPGDPAGWNGKYLYWQQVLPSLRYAANNGHILSIHQYGWPTLDSPSPVWYIRRFEEQVLPWLKELNINIKTAITEIGLDQLIHNVKGGWKSTTNAQDYTNELIDWERNSKRYDRDIIGATIFTMGDSGGWGDYNIQGEVVNLLSEYYKKNPQSSWNNIPTETLPKVVLGAAPTESILVSNEPTKPPIPDLTPHFSAAAKTIGVKIRNILQSKYKIKDIFTTQNGSWVPTNNTSLPFSIEEQFRHYLTPNFHEAGGDHHLFVNVLDKAGNQASYFNAAFWSDGVNNFNSHILRGPDGKSKWANIPLFSGSGFSVFKGELGPWSIKLTSDTSDIVYGLGLPDFTHTSTFIVYQEI